MSPNVKDFVEMAVEYGVEHLGTSMAASTGSPSNGLEEAISGSTVDGGVEGIRELGLR
jgi:hypothetical protein